MDFDKLYPNRFLKAGEFGGRDVTLTVTGVKIEELESEKGKKVKGIVSFNGTPKQLVLNRTNGEAIKLMFGRETNDWIGKRVTFFPAQITDSFTGEPGLAIRVRGSPDIDGPKQVSAKIGRKTVQLKVAKTGPAAPAKAAPKQAAKPPAQAAAPKTPPAEVHNFEPEVDPNTGEVVPPLGEEPPPFDPVTGELLP